MYEKKYSIRYSDLQKKNRSQDTIIYHNSLIHYKKVNKCTSECSWTHIYPLLFLYIIYYIVYVCVCFAIFVIQMKQKLAGTLSALSVGTMPIFCIISVNTFYLASDILLLQILAGHFILHFSHTRCESLIIVFSWSW